MRIGFSDREEEEGLIGVGQDDLFDIVRVTGQTGEGARARLDELNASFPSPTSETSTRSPTATTSVPRRSRFSSPLGVERSSRPSPSCMVKNLPKARMTTPGIASGFDAGSRRGRAGGDGRDRFRGLVGSCGRRLPGESSRRLARKGKRQLPAESLLWA